MNKLLMGLLKDRWKKIDKWQLARNAAFAALAASQAAYQIKPSWPEAVWAGLGGAAIAAWNFIVNPEKTKPEAKSERNLEGDVVNEVNEEQT